MHLASAETALQDDGFDDVTEFCSWAKIGRTSFYAEVKAGRIRIVKFGEKTLVPREERRAFRARLMSQLGEQNAA